MVDIYSCRLIQNIYYKCDSSQVNEILRLTFHSFTLRACQILSYGSHKLSHSCLIIPMEGKCFIIDEKTRAQGGERACWFHGGWGNEIGICCSVQTELLAHTLWLYEPDGWNSQNLEPLMESASSHAYQMCNGASFVDFL